MGHRRRGPEYERAAARLGEVLRDLRLGARLTIEELAAKVDEPVAFVEKIERGSYVVDPFELEELSAAYGISFVEALKLIKSAVDEVRQ
jgi:transcriptional regulator with XRE-family HTH domain